MLELRNINKRFGEVLANDSVSIVVRPGTIHAIIGENGAGKSTAMRVAYGFYIADSGEIVIDGEPRIIRSPHDAIRYGVGMVHQHFTLVDTMTVTENIVLGAEPGSAVALDLRKAAETIRELSREFGLPVRPDALVSELSVGEQQRVEILKALYRRARLLILDEPTAVLTPQEIDSLFATLRQMREQGRTVVIITHKLAEVLAISDEVSVMRDGKVVGRLETAKTNAAELARLMVGRDVLLRVSKTPAKPGASVLEVSGLSLNGLENPRLRNISFQVRAGEIVGIAGVEGNGQTELVEAIAGLIPPARLSGSIRLSGSEIRAFSARRRKDLGIGHIPEDRHRRGLLLDFLVNENGILGVHHRRPFVRPAGFMDGRAIQERSKRIVEQFDVRPPNPLLPARAFSGGNQQKIIIGREFMLPPKMLLVSQPTRGVDIGAIEFIHKQLIELRDSGCAILLVSAELEEVTALSDRLLVMHDGEIAGEVDPLRASKEEIGLLMLGGKKSGQEARTA